MAEVGAGPVTGADCFLYYDSGADGAGGAWQLIDEVGDVSFNAGLNVAEMKRRAKRYTKNLASLYDSFTAEFTLIHGLNSAIFDALRGAFFARTVWEYAFMDGVDGTSASEGFRCPMIITQFPFNQPLEDVAGHQIQLSIAYMLDAGSEEIDPSWDTATLNLVQWDA